MARLGAVAASALTVWLIQVARADSDGGILLPPVAVPLPPPELATDAPSKRDPTGALFTVETASHPGEAKDTAQLLATSPGALVQELGGLGQLFKNPTRLYVYPHFELDSGKARTTRQEALIRELGTQCNHQNGNLPSLPWLKAL